MGEAERKGGDRGRDREGERTRKRGRGRGGKRDRSDGDRQEGVGFKALTNKNEEQKVLFMLLKHQPARV